MSPCNLYPVNLRCEYLENPFGLGERQPRLSWYCEPTDTSARGYAQTAWQVQVKRAGEGFESPSLWDSGKVSSDECAQIVYSGTPLQSNDACEWRVRVWDQNDSPSQWSETATWRMGLLNQEDWRARCIEAPALMVPSRCKWIWARDEAANADQSNRVYTFETVVEIPPGRKVVRAMFLGAGPASSTLKVNGRAVGDFGGQAGPDSNFHLLDPTSTFVEGVNRIQIGAAAKDAKSTAITGKLVYTLDDQSQHVLSVDEDWTVDSKPESAICVAYVGQTDPIGGALNPWGIPGTESGLILPPVASFRHVFELDAIPVDAVSHVCTFGIHEMWINGSRVGQEYFAPGWSDYTKRVRSISHDIRGFLRKGTNVVVVHLAEGWHSGYVAWGRRRDHYPGEPRFMAQFHLTDSSGAENIFGTDGSWRVTRQGPFREADLLMGETFDARVETAHWFSPDYAAGEFGPVLLSPPRAIQIDCYPGNPVVATGELKPSLMMEPRPGVHIFDMGQNFAGVARLKMNAPRGTVVTMRHAEVLTDDGELYTEALRGARCVDTYIKGADGEETWQPRFTFHGFRYLEVSGLPSAPSLDDVRGVVLHNFMEQSGEIATSNVMVNRLVENIRWGQRGNFLEVPTDCPQRDERLGWTGDAQIFIRTGSFNYDIGAFFTKWLRDLFDSQTEEGWFHAVAPAVNLWPNPDICYAAWTDAAIICPWTLFKVYGDTRIVSQYWDGMVRLMQHLEATSDHLIRPNVGFGDWVSLNSHTPLDLVGTAYFAYDAMLMAEMAESIGRREEARAYINLYERIKAAFQKRFVEPGGTIAGKTQCAYVLALRFGLLPEELRPAAVAHLAQDIAYRRGHFSTGFIGLKDLMPTLSDNGRHDLAVNILLNDEFPSWGYQIRHGATTVWERWDGWSEELGLQNPGMNSFNHYAFGAVGEWMYTHLAGIDMASTAYRRIRMRPLLSPRLRNVRARYRTCRGWASAEWCLDSTKSRVTLRCRVPAGTLAEICLPAARIDEIRESGSLLRDTAHKILRETTRETVIEIPAGHYTFEFPAG